MAIDPDAGLLGRRVAVFGLTCAGWLALAVWAGAALGAPGWTVARALVLGLFLVGAPWTLLAFWNSVIGLWLLLCVPGPAARVNPALAATPLNDDTGAAGAVAVCMAVRNEDPVRVLARMEAMIGDLAATGHLGRFAFHVISDSDVAEGAEEAAAVAALCARLGMPGVVRHRRRMTNEGYKAGNLQDFARAVLGTHDVMIVLDADSLMSGAALLRLARVMAANPCLGIVQTLVVGRPADSAFARIFQFGMRHGMRSHTLGAAWWQGPSGPFWGHNAAVRVAPFVAHCAMPVLPGGPPFGGTVLSHDQVEAALMRTAGWEVRVVADEDGSWEENPPSLPDFIRRNLRWCQGNLQYVHLVARTGFRPMGRFQLVNALLMYVGPVAWTAMLLTGLVAAVLGQDGVVKVAFGGYLLMLLLGFLPRVFGVVDALVRTETRLGYGGAARLMLGCVVDAAGSMLTLPVTMVSEAVFATGMLLGQRISWTAQARDERVVPLMEAVRMLWPQTMLGGTGVVGLWVAAPAALGWAAPVLAAWLLAVPWAYGSAQPGFGRWMRARRLCAVPDEFAPAPILRRLDQLGGTASSGVTQA